MKLSLVAMIAFVFVSCSKQTDDVPREEKKSSNTEEAIKEKPEGTGVVVNSCDYFDVPVPTTYFGTNVYTYPAGFGNFANPYYDKGWKAGYEDGLFYLSYYEIPGSEIPFNSFTLKKGIQDVNSPGNIRYVDPDYVLQPGETSLGIFVIFNSSTTINWALVSCVLWESYDSKSLRLRYEFYKNYVGTKNSDEIEFDNGRYDGYIKAITTQPYTVAP